MIPTQQKKSENRIPKENIATNQGIVFSFKALEFNKYFNLDMTCPNWSLDLFKMLISISSVSKRALIQGEYRTYRVHDHSNANPPCDLPRNVSLKDFYQIRISQSKGGIHGVFVDNIFYVMWIDPLHNMYPDNRFGGLREVSPPTTCCGEPQEKLEEMYNKIKTIEEENRIYKELFENS